MHLPELLGPLLLYMYVVVQYILYVYVQETIFSYTYTYKLYSW
jgi:hypothetical protein